MAIDSLHEKIRKLKSPVIVDLGMKMQSIPPQILESAESAAAAYKSYCTQLLEALKGSVPGVRFSFGAFALLGTEGLDALSAVLTLAKELGFYVFLDAPEVLSPWSAELTAELLMGEGSQYPCDAVIASPYIGSDAIKPFIPYCKKQQKELFLIVRSPNKTASELQDLMTGSRLVHGAAADIVCRHGEPLVGKCAYSQIGALVSAGAPESLRTLRTKYKYTFFLVDGLDYPSGNAKNCSAAFDRFGYGAAVCVATSVTEAWKEEGSGSASEAAVQATDRIRKNLLRYFSIL